ncbi:MAG: GNAT family N-acetyltransferase [Thermoprotei archaeon]
MDSEPAIVRNFVESDLKSVMELESCFEPCERYTEKDFVRLSRPPAVFLVAEVNSRIAGYILIRRQGRMFEIVSIAVKPENRRRGIGRLLFEEAFRRLDGRGDGFRLAVREGNDAAKTLYVSLDFKVVGRVPRYYCGEEDALIMERKCATNAKTPHFNAY